MIVLIAWFVVQWGVGVPPKYTVIAIASLRGSVAIYEVAGRVPRHPLRYCFCVVRRACQSARPPVTVAKARTTARPIASGRGRQPSMSSDRMASKT